MSDKMNQSERENKKSLHCLRRWFLSRPRWPLTRGLWFVWACFQWLGDQLCERECVKSLTYLRVYIYIYIYAIENLSSTVNQSEWDEFSEGKYRWKSEIRSEWAGPMKETQSQTKGILYLAHGTKRLSLWTLGLWETRDGLRMSFFRGYEGSVWISKSVTCT